jgi:activator of 2-hydroxyglutaryl-CoA dehydratase
MAYRLKVDIESFNSLAEKSKKEVQIGSYCTVFSATEILTKIREGVEIEDLVKGVFDSIIKRAAEMDVLDGNIVMSGGVVAHNPYLVKMFEEKIGNKIFVPPYPQLTGAFGAALFARDQKE